jgi:peptidoglycan/xylan/chitin deacetylase (PgdA/CDA1 family)
VALRIFVLTLVVAGNAGARTQFHEVERIPTRQKIVALTFDGGDNAGGARRILATLKRRRVPATFFVTGRWVRRYPRLARAVGAYAVGNHTYDHADLTRLSSAAVRAEIRRGAYWVRVKTGREPRPLFRFPYGARDARTMTIVNGLGYASVRWSLDTWGWMGPSGGQSTRTVLERVATRLRPGDVVLMHLGFARDGSLLDAQALPAVIRLIQRRGYRLVSLGPYVRAP